MALTLRKKQLAAGIAAGRGRRRRRRRRTRSLWWTPPCIALLAAVLRRRGGSTPSRPPRLRLRRRAPRRRPAPRLRLACATYLLLSFETPTTIRPRSGRGRAARVRSGSTCLHFSLREEEFAAASSTAKQRVSLLIGQSKIYGMKSRCEESFYQMEGSSPLQ